MVVKPTPSLYGPILGGEDSTGPLVGGVPSLVGIRLKSGPLSRYCETSPLRHLASASLGSLEAVYEGKPFSGDKASSPHSAWSQTWPRPCAPSHPLSEGKAIRLPNKVTSAVVIALDKRSGASSYLAGIQLDEWEPESVHHPIRVLVHIPEDTLLWALCQGGAESYTR